MSDNMKVTIAIVTYLVVVGILVSCLFVPAPASIQIIAGLTLLALIGTTLGLIAAY